MFRPTTAVLTLALTATLFLPTSAQKDDKKWDVAADLGPATKLAFDTDEGTWMNVDVSPDGKRIVFDLLGDIYVMPIDGARAGSYSTCSRGSAPTARASRSPATATACGTSGRWTWKGRTRSRSPGRSGGSSTARRGRRTANTSTRAGIS